MEKKKVHLGKHNRCEFHQTKVLICWGSILLSLVYKTSENETSKKKKKKSLSFKERENAEKRLNGYLKKKKKLKASKMKSLKNDNLKLI